MKCLNAKKYNRNVGVRNLSQQDYTRSFRFPGHPEKVTSSETASHIQWWWCLLNEMFKIIAFSFSNVLNHDRQGTHCLSVGSLIREDKIILSFMTLIYLILIFFILQFNRNKFLRVRLITSYPILFVLNTVGYWIRPDRSLLAIEYDQIDRVWLLNTTWSINDVYWIGPDRSLLVTE